MRYTWSIRGRNKIICPMKPYKLFIQWYLPYVSSPLWSTAAVAAAVANDGGLDSLNYSSKTNVFQMEIHVLADFNCYCY